MEKKKEVLTGKVLAEGKTKQILETSLEGMVALRNKDDMTKHDDPSQTEVAAGKAAVATATTSRVFRVLNASGIPTAFVEPIDGTTFLALGLEMIPLEVVCRRYAVGSYLKRNPHLARPGDSAPARFSRLEYELFLKTTGRRHKTETPRGPNVLELPCDDPMVDLVDPGWWDLYDPKAPRTEGSFLGRVRAAAAPPVLARIEEIARKTFLLLEGFWGTLGYRLVDFKLEFGVENPGDKPEDWRIRVGDVIDGDSWRLRTLDWEEMSKERFRQGEAASEVLDKYQVVLGALEGFWVEQDLVVLWTGSDKDDTGGFPVVNNPWLETDVMAISGHKGTVKALKALEAMRVGFRRGVIVDRVGLSNGLGPVLASHTDWQVVNWPDLRGAGSKSNVWSSLAMPSNVPCVTVLRGSNAALAAYGVLAPGNPWCYMVRRYAAEQFDDGVVV